MSRWQTVWRWILWNGPAFVTVAVLIAAWQFAAKRNPQSLLPGPLPVLRGIGELLTKGLLLKYIVASLFRITWGYLAAAVLAIPFGLLLGWYRRAGCAAGPLLQILRPISPLAWIPISILWFGVGDMAAIFLIFLASFLPITVASMNAVRNIEGTLLRAGRNFGLSEAQLVRWVLYPAVMPQLIVSLRITLGIAWLVVVAAEMIAVNSGLGFLIVDARNAGNRYDLVVGGMVLIGVLGFILDTAIRRLEKTAQRAMGLRGRVVNPAPHKLAISNLSVGFPRDGGTVEVLRNINFDAREGEFVCLLGPSGCGKSTLLNVAGGFLKPTSGAVTIDGEPVTGPDPRRIFVFQERGVFPWLTVEGNIGFGLFRLPREQKAGRIAHYVKLVGLTGFEKAYPQELSGGMKQRLEVARALAVNPDMLFLDEPFGSLDSITRLVMRGELLRIWQAERKTILFVTHDIDESVQLADRVVIFSNRPASIRRVVEIDIPHPRDISSRRYLELRDDIFEEIGLAHKV